MDGPEARRPVRAEPPLGVSRGRLRSFVRLSPRRHLLLAEAFVMLLWGVVVVRAVGVRRYSGRLGESHPGEFHDELPVDKVRLSEIRWAITAVNRLFGKRFNCLMQGIAGKTMLNRRGISNSLVLGSRLVPGGEFKAHAWLWSGQAIILGGETRNEYVALTTYHSG